MMEEENNQELEFSITKAEAVRLSPIDEMNESNIVEDSLIEDQIIGETPSFQDCSMISQDSDSCQTKSDFKRSFSLNIPIYQTETPPAVLRKRFEDLKKEFEIIRHEHDELQEFTTLEKQIEHHNCVPKIEMSLLKDELDMVNEKMECLMQDNENLRNEIDQKEQQNQELKRSFTASLNTIQVLENFVSKLGYDLKESLQHDAQEIIENNSALRNLIDNYGEHGKTDDEKQLNTFEEIKNSNYSSVFEGIKHLLECVLTIRFDLNNEVQCLDLKNKELQTNLKKLAEEKKVCEKSIPIEKCKINELKEQLCCAEVEVDKLKDLLAVSEQKLAESNRLLHSMQLDSEKIELKANIKTLDCQLETVLNRINILETTLANTMDENTILKEKLISTEKGNESELIKFQKTLQNSYVSLISEFKNIIGSLDFKEGLKVLFDNLEKNYKVFDNVDCILGSQTVQAISDLLNTLKIKLISYDEHRNLSLYEFNSRSKQSQDEINELTHEINDLKTTVKDELTSRLEQLECLFHHFGENVIDFNGSDRKITSKEATNKEYRNEGEITPEHIVSRDKVEINDIEKELNYIFNYIDKCLNSNNPFANFKDFIDCNMENHNFTQLSKLVDKDINSLFLNLYDKLKKNECFKCQKTQENLCTGDPLCGLKDLLMVEILSLDSSERKKNLLNYSSKDIFDKFMLSIMKRQAEVTSELQEGYETCLDQMKAELEVLSKKVKFQSSRISELECEQSQMNSEIEVLDKSKCEIESISKSLSNSLENTLNDMSGLKKSTSQLTSENNVLRDKLKKCNQLVKSEKATVDYLKVNLRRLKKEFQFETKNILSLIPKLSSLILKKENSCTCRESKLSGSSEEFFDDQECIYPGIDRCISFCAKCSSTEDSELTTVEDSIKKEKLLLKELILSDSSGSSVLFSKFHFLQDVAEIFFNKIYELENLQTKTEAKFQNTVDTVNRDLSDLKLSIFKLYKEFVPEEENAIHETLNSNSYSGNVMSLQKELECVEEECRELTIRTDKFQNIIKASLGFINSLKDQFTDMVYKTSKQDMDIEELYRTVFVEQHKNKELKKEYKTVSKKLESYSQQNSQLEMEIKNLNLQLTDINFVFTSTHFTFPVHIKDLKEKIRYLNDIYDENIFLKSSAVETSENVKFFSNQCNLMLLYIGSIEKAIDSLLEERTKLEEQVKHFSSELSDTVSILTSVKRYMPAELEDSKEKIKYMCNIFKENTDVKSSITIANESISFFSYQNMLMNDYIKNIETSINILLGQKKQSDYEFDLVKSQLKNTKTHLDEANKVFNLLLSLLPSNSNLSPVQAVNLVGQIIAKNNTLKASEVNSIKKQKSMEETISKQLEEINSLNKLNENIKRDQGQFEDNIRNLRSELRSLRLQYQKKLEECNAKPSCITNFESTEFGIQTDVLCCPELEREILILKETLREYNNKIQFLERRIHSRSSPYKRNPDLELALFQAKERIKELRTELMKKENYNKDLIELFQSKENCSQKYESSSQEN